MIWPKSSDNEHEQRITRFRLHKRGALALVLLLPLLAAGLYVGLHRSTLPPPVAPILPDVVAPPVASVEFHRDIKPIFENRCAVCHGCYDAPCQLKLDSADGVMRGATKARVYESTRLVEAPLTRLFIDAQTTEQWRAKDFFPVLYEGEAPIDELARLDGSLLYKMLALKRANPMPRFGPRENARERFDLGLDRREFCPAPEQFDRYAREHPLWGMPYGLPGIGDDEFNTVKRWIEAGSPVAERPPLDRPVQDQIAGWEKFLNNADFKVQLLARYVYEHLFLADIYFPDLTIAPANQPYFKLVRSRTPPGQPLDIVNTRRPYDDPGVERVFYRFMPVNSAILAKTHLPYALNEKRRQRWRELFLDPKYDVPELPSYAPDVAANPFLAFHDLPVRARYKFLLDDAAFTISNFIKGPVCRGQIALNVVDDRFWVLFADPDVEAMVDAGFLARESDNLRLPAADAEKKGSPLTFWNRYAKLQGDYLAAKSKYLHAQFGRPDALTTALLWKGDGFNATAPAGDPQKNPNAALTVFRHADSGSVVQGWVGDTPKTAWVIDYPMLERIHYLLVAGFDVYGDARHQLLTRLYMDFLRMEGEYNFLYFLPQKKREAERNSWYQGVGAKLRDSVYAKVPMYRTETGMVYKTRDYKTEFFEQLRAQMGGAIDTRYALTTNDGPADEIEQMRKLDALRGRAASYLPEVTFLRVVRKGAPDMAYTLLHDRDYSNVALLLLDRERRRPQNDALTVVPGFIGAYPNAFWRVTDTEVPDLVRRLTTLRTPQDYRALLERYAIGRDNEKFWPHSDWMHRLYREREPVNWGLFDFNRYE